MTVAVSSTVVPPSPCAGRWTTPSAETTSGFAEAQATFVPYEPVAGRVMLPRTSSRLSTFSASAARSVAVSSSNAAGTVTSNDLVSVTDPFFRVAVSVAWPSGSPAAGRVTAPESDTTEGVSLSQLIEEPPAVPVPGRVRSATTALVSPRVRAALSSATPRVATGRESCSTSEPANARS